MFFLQSKLTQFASAISVRHAQRHISIAPGRVLGFFKDKVKEESAEETSVALVEDEFEEEEKLKRIDMIRNKSGLLPQHRNILHGKVPYAQSESWIHNTLKYKRKMYGKFGESSELDPRICFWTPSELKEKQEYERVAFPKTVPEMIAENQEQKRLRKESILAREAQIQKNLEKLEQWKKDITMRKEKKETEARLAKERKERLIEEVRRHFGYTIDPRDERFKEMLEMKEKEQRKAMKESKRQAKESKMMTKLMENKSGESKKTQDSSDVDVDDVDKK